MFPDGFFPSVFPYFPTDFFTEGFVASVPIDVILYGPNNAATVYGPNSAATVYGPQPSVSIGGT